VNTYLAQIFYLINKSQFTRGIDTHSANLIKLFCDFAIAEQEHAPAPEENTDSFAESGGKTSHSA
jgi:hypothetical protein